MVMDSFLAMVPLILCNPYRRTGFRNCFLYRNTRYFLNILAEGRALVKF